MAISSYSHPNGTLEHYLWQIADSLQKSMQRQNNKSTNNLSFSKLKTHWTQMLLYRSNWVNSHQQGHQNILVACWATGSSPIRYKLSRKHRVRHKLRNIKPIRGMTVSKQASVLRTRWIECQTWRRRILSLLKIDMVWESGIKVFLLRNRIR